MAQILQNSSITTAQINWLFFRETGRENVLSNDTLQSACRLVSPEPGRLTSILICSVCPWNHGAAEGNENDDLPLRQGLGP